MTYVPSDGIYPVMGLHPHVVGGISLIVTARFIPYPAFPPYDVKKLHPGLRPTSATYMRSSYSLRCMMKFTIIGSYKATADYKANTSWLVLGRLGAILGHHMNESYKATTYLKTNKIHLGSSWVVM